MSTVVIKLGGNALSTETGIRDAVHVIAAQQRVWDNVVVVSAALSGVTDALHNIVTIAQSGNRNDFREDIAGLRAIHLEAARSALSDPHLLDTLLRELDVQFFNLLDDCEMIRQKSQADSAIADRIVARGEMWVTRIIATAARGRSMPCVPVDASRLIITDDRYGNARPIISLTEKQLALNLLPLLRQGVIPIITGYIGANEKGNVTTLGRGGSDYSATYLGALLDADEVWFYTDVDGLMSADPAIVKDARVLPACSYREVAEMAHFGAHVLHPHAIEPLIEPKIPLRIRALDNPENGGTYICDHIETSENRIHAITQVMGLRVVGASQNNMIEVCNRLMSQYLNDDIQPTLQTEVHAGTMIIYIAPTSTNRAALYDIMSHLETYEASGEWRVDPVTVIAVVGNLLLDDYVMVLGALSKANITPLAFGDGSQGVLLVVVKPDDAIPSMGAIHELVG